MKVFYGSFWLVLPHFFLPNRNCHVPMRKTTCVLKKCQAKCSQMLFPSDPSLDIGVFLNLRTVFKFVDILPNSWNILNLFIYIFSKFLNVFLMFWTFFKFLYFYKLVNLFKSVNTFWNLWIFLKFMTIFKNHERLFMSMNIVWFHQLFKTKLLVRNSELKRVGI